MEKIIIKCPHCNSKMKIGLKSAKYRCPNCQEIYKLTMIKLFLLRVKGFFIGIKETLVDIKTNIVNKYKSVVATYKYMKQVKENMKRDPNWSNYHKEEREIKKAQRDSGTFGDFFKRRKK